MNTIKMINMEDQELGMGWNGNDGLRAIDKPMIYEIQLQGHLDKSWSSWLEGMVITYEGDRTVLTGRMVDQSALRGLLSKVWDLNQTLVSLIQVEEPSPLAKSRNKYIN